MKAKTMLLAGMLFLTSVSNAQEKPSWDKWGWLIGEWVGEGEGQPGKGGGIFSFYPDLDKKILVRKSHSEYPATAGKPEIKHDDLMVIYPDFNGNPSKAIYFDNEGHTINYEITYADKFIILTSSKMANIPVFKLTYSLLDSNTINTKFEMSQDGEKFVTYIEGKSKKTK